jgi:hypothetical protein
MLRACSMYCRYLAVASKVWYGYGLSRCGRAKSLCTSTPACNVTACRNTVSWQYGRDSWPRTVSKVGYAVTLRACLVYCQYLAVASKGWYCYGRGRCGCAMSLCTSIPACNVTAYRNTVSWQCGRDSWPRTVLKVGYAVTLRACSVCGRYLTVASKGWYGYGLSRCGRATWHVTTVRYFLFLLKV